MKEHDYFTMMIKAGLICKECSSEVRIIITENKEAIRAKDGLCYYHAKKKAGLFGDGLKSRKTGFSRNW